MKTLLGILFAALSTAAFAAVTPLSGSGQQAPAGTPFPEPIRVQVTDAAGQPAAGARTVFILGLSLAGGGRLTSPSTACDYESFFGYRCTAAADSQGIASLTVIADAVGRYQITAEAFPAVGMGYLGNISEVMFVDALPAAPRSIVEVLAGDNQRTALGTAFPQRIRLRATRPDGTPVAGATVWFDVMQGTQATWGPWGVPIPPPTAMATTNAAGEAEAPALYAFRGVGEGTVRASMFDPASRDYIPILARFTNTYADGSTFASFQDLWWSGSTENGWGFVATQQDTRLFNVVYAYDAAGKPTWYMVSDGAWIAGLGSVHQGDVYTPTGSPYFAYDASRFDAGPKRTYLAFSFMSDAERATLYMGSVDGVNVVTEKSLTRFQFAGTGASPVQGVGGLWWGGASQNGWGLSVIERAGALFVVWFTYDAEGKATWFSMSEGRWRDGNTWTGNVYRTSGSPWAGMPYDASRFRVDNVGTFEMRFDGTQAATFTYDVEGHRGTVPLARFTF